VNDQTAEYVVVGAGIIGAATAASLARSGTSPLVVEAKDTFAGGATGSSGGMVRCYDPDPVVARLAAASLTIYSDPTAWSSGVAPLRRVGAVTLAAPEQADVLAVAARTLRAAGWECEVIGEAEVVLGVRTAGGVALAEPMAGWVDPQLVTELFLRQATADGATVLAGARVTGLTSTSSGVILETSRGTVHATNGVVLAVGGWAARTPLDAALGSHVRTRAIQTAIVGRPPRAGQHATFIDLRTGGYGKPMSDGTSLVGYPLLVWDVDPDAAVSADIAHQRRTIEAVAESLPWLTNSTVVRVTRSFDAFREGDEVLVATDLPRVWLCRPGNGGGVKVAPELGREIALRLLSETGQEIQT
jgi:glycine/D-amino acid oxidase-like deaminating enzyme